MASKVFHDIRPVGRDNNTSADIYAGLLLHQAGTRIRFFVEVKRENQKVGIAIINSLVGAISLEKEKFGWHAGIIVSVTGVKSFKKHSKAELQLRGVDLKDRSDLLVWLQEYVPNKDGLWLPDPKKSMPSADELI